MAELTYEQVSKLLKYEPETGKLFWLPRTPDMFPPGHRSSETNCKVWNRRYAGKQAFPNAGSIGYRMGTIFHRMYYAHRLIVLLQTKEWPSGQVDHINGDRGDNRLANLRVVSAAENRKNQRMRRNNTSGVTGVYWSKQRGTWRAQIKLNGSRITLGSFADKSSAIAARKAAEIEFGFHPNHGI